MLTKAYVSASNFFHSFKNDERGVTAIEYGLIAVAMAVLVTTAVGPTGFIGKLEAAFAQVATSIDTASDKS
ncbi:Flp family type IVb pilin [Vibrio sp. 10N.286.45.A3]|uniref:Flp family type IVb pilin n=1 Tax=Vibrio TaxID=662 RepID=UPI000C83AA12|nr:MULTISPECIES: Flp family type IVb pilin [unclassified Vibrio]PMI19898.1 pilus assembly protein [Vibrio sp. 10N.286.46.E10]PTO98098.1 Flp family type IVb pilin [Vibrio sp. 10N.286.48.B8]PTP02047.1 Flp family type IVb pilin [Vibrio sp. 10N.286.45.A3]TKE76062.1 Flp family type IVb pilin [Vibrio sp. F12]TKE87194.1 Flp family type IVb pilin [Vibrio sp. F12]